MSTSTTSRWGLISPFVFPLVVGLALARTVSAVDLEPRVDVAAGTEPLGVAITDMDGDGMPDLLTTIHEEDTLALFRQVRGADPVRFAPKVEVATGLHPQEVVVADFDGDGRPDVAIANSGRAGGGSLSVFRNTSSPGTITLDPRIDFDVDTARRLAIGDLDGDGKTDIAVSSNSPKQFEIFRNTSTLGTVAFSLDISLAAANSPNSLELADIDGDGRLDLVAPNNKEDILSVYPNTSTSGAISFGSRVDFPAGDETFGPVVAQFDGQGGPDVVVTNLLSSTVLLFINQSTPGNFAFAPPESFPAGFAPREPEVGDLNHDGLPEVILLNHGDDSISVLSTTLDAGTVSLELAAQADSGLTPALAVLGDLNADGALDIAVGQQDDESVGIFLNATEAALAPDHLLLCEVGLTPSAAELIEIVNPTSETVSLEPYFLADDQDYALLPGAFGAGPAPAPLASDFIVQFPVGASIAPDEVVVVAMDGAAFASAFGFTADYEVLGTDPATPDMLPIDLGGSATLTDSGEHVVLFVWDGASDLVDDIDMIRVGRPTVGGSNDIADKTGIAVDGPDVDTDPSTYLDDAFTMPVASSDPGSGESVKRSLLEGPSEQSTDGNSLNGHDETTENILITWDSEFEYLPADPGVCCLTLPCYYAPVDPTDASTMRASLHEVVDDHLRWPYSSTWDILELADEDPLEIRQIVDLYKNAPYPKDRIDYEREHTWPSSYGFPDDLTTNYPFTDTHHLFLADGSYNASRSNKPYRFCHPDCDEKITLNYDGRGGGSGPYPGLSNWTEGTLSTGTWEAWFGRRGDVARAILYMDVRYEGDTHGVAGAAEPDLRLTDNDTLIADSNTGSNESTGYMGILTDLLQWHEEDPVDHRERWRNDVIVRYQRNRNPFIDHPEWVDCIYGNVCPGVDLTIVKDDEWPDAVAGESVIYAIEIGNLGPDDVAGAVVTDVFDAQRFDVGAITWTCTPVAGAGAGTACPASGSAMELENGVAVDVEAGDTVIFTVDCPVLASATGTLVNTAAVVPPGDILERDDVSNSDTDTNDLPALGSCGKPDERVLTDTTVTTIKLAEACTSITAGSEFRVEAPGDVTFRVGERIILRNGFSVGAGGKFIAEIDPGLAQ